MAERSTKIRDWSRQHEDSIWAWLIGFGLILFAVHNRYQPLKEYAFLPVIGLLLSTLATFLVLNDHRKEITLGSKWLYIPILTLIGSIIISGVVNGNTVQERIAPSAIATYLFSIYLVARILKEKLLAPFTFAIIIEAISCIVYGLIYYGQPTGGIISPSSNTFWGNWDIATGLLIFGLMVSAVRRQWWLSAIVLVGLYFTGSAEGIFATGILIATVLIRRDWSRKALLPAITLAGLLIFGFSTGHVEKLYFLTYDRADTARALAANIIDKPTEAPPVIVTMTIEEKIDRIIGRRWSMAKNAALRIAPFGHGYSMTKFNQSTVHNVPMVIADQIGIAGATAWTVATVYLLWRTKWKYAWVAVIALGVFDHFIWTQVAPWWWALAGVSSAVIKEDLIFKRVEAK